MDRQAVFSIETKRDVAGENGVRQDGHCTALLWVEIGDVDPLQDNRVRPDDRCIADRVTSVRRCDRVGVRAAAAEKRRVQPRRRCECVGVVVKAADDPGRIRRNERRNVLREDQVAQV